MRSSLVRIAWFGLFLGVACAVPQLLAHKKNNPPEPDTTEQRRAVQALNRLSFGPRPGDVQHVAAMGVDAWIDLQLHPEKIPDSALQSRLAPFRTLHMSSKEIVEEFPDNQIIKQVFDGKKPMPSDAAKRAVFQVQLARLEGKKERKQEAAAPANVPSPTKTSDNPAKTPSSMEDDHSGAAAAPGAEMSSPPPVAVDATAERHRERRDAADLKVQELINLAPAERYQTILLMPADQQLAFADSLRGNKAQDVLAGLDPKQRETLLAMDNPDGVVVDELVQAKLLRAIYSDRQLEEVMTDFWFNHFNVFVNKGAERVLLTNYEQQVIRPRALGKFEDLLVATAKSPAMLFYLDNWLSVGPSSMQALGLSARLKNYPRHPAKPNAKRKQTSGLNENYGRELLELHTLSVNGGYSQRDVTEVAKVFTGWTIDKPYDGGSFKFDPRMHEPGPKFVLGHRIKAKGENEGREVLHRLATSEQTAHFISLKLAQRFVSDDPPPALVDRMAKTFEKKKGDIREVLATLFHSPEFWTDGNYRAKVKTPLEFVASAVRATGAEVEDALPLTRQLNNMGMPLYRAQPPTGYSMKAETWVSSSALLGRMNFALALTAGKVKGVAADAIQLSGGPPAPTDSTQALSNMEEKLLAGDVSQQTHESILAQMQTPAKPKTKTEATDLSHPDRSKDKSKETADKPPKPLRPSDVNTMAGLLLGSPEFQKK
jgi:uncharacterized protein (DUF1800 family)